MPRIFDNIEQSLLPAEDLREALSIIKHDETIDNQTALRRLAAQIRAKKVVVKLFLRHQLYAKLYLLFRSDPISPTVGYLGSSNLTFAGLSHQGELNVDVVDQDAVDGGAPVRDCPDPPCRLRGGGNVSREVSRPAREAEEGRRMDGPGGGIAGGRPAQAEIIEILDRIEGRRRTIIEG